MTMRDFAHEDYCDELGPAKIVHVYDPHTKMRGMIVVDNIACGPAIGGVRMAADVTTGEVFRLARAMTLKNAAAGLPHGGGKAGIVADPKSANKPEVVRAFARAIRCLDEYIPGPDMGTDETCMAWVHDETGRSVGLPRVLGGIPLDELGATGYGLAKCAEVAAEFCELELQGATVAIEGFGNVGQHAARFLAEYGVKLVAASDSKGTVYDPDGFDIDQLIALKHERHSVVDCSQAEILSREQLFQIPCDILVPAARPDSIHAGNVHGIQARLILQGANIPATEESEKTLHERNILNIPDFIANAGGVICAAVEYQGGTEKGAFEAIAQKVMLNTRETLQRCATTRQLPREAAMDLARERVFEAMSYRV
jgi:glutamate dehydrogenase (NAD(P)+)/glutamate dehydrogenase (NADP+)